MKTPLLYICLILTVFCSAQISFKSSNFEQGIRKHLNVDEDYIITQNSLDTIRKIDLSSLQIRDIQDVHFLKKVRQIDLSNNHIKNITPLLSLPHIRVMDISDNNIKNISTFVFSDNRHFKLNIKGNVISDFSVFNSAIFSNVVIIGADDQFESDMPEYLLKYIIPSTKQDGQPIFNYDVWDSDNNCTEFVFDFGNGNSINNLECGVFSNTLEYTYSNSGFKNIKIERGTESINEHFIAPFEFEFFIGSEVELNFNLPDEITFIEVDNNENLGVVEITNNSILYTPTNVGSDDLRISYYYQNSKHQREFYTFISNSNTLDTQEFNLNEVAIYPNPTQGIINIRNAEKLNIKQINIYDTNGKLLKTIAWDASKNELNISDFPAQTYVLEIITQEGKIMTKKVIKK